MATCDVCGNDYDGAFTLQRGSEQGTFDSFECAIHAMAPRCEHCSCVIVGHGVQAGDRVFCCAHCAAQAGVEGAADRV
jgi:phage terminase large subunit GpA-like protein